MLNVQIITPERSLPAQEAAHVTLTTVDGEIGIRSGHAPVVAQLKTGFAMIRAENGKETYLALKDGSAMVLKDQVKIYVESAIDAATVDMDKIQQRLEQIGKVEAKDDLEKRRLNDEATWQLMQLSVAQRVSHSGVRKAV